MSVDKDLDAELRKAARLPKADYKKPMPENEGNTSRGGDGMKTAGEGTANEVKGTDKSTANKENASVQDTLYQLKAWDDKGVTVLCPTGKTFNMTYEDFKTFLN